MYTFSLDFFSGPNTQQVAEAVPYKKFAVGLQVC